ncbi:threonine synthase [Pelagibius litoralis]|uniref:Threonine synthase n=1 Tax=Pelagibius litoralis TaxID=374515 RepID=A0A967KGJ5_9PROT|nr:threonine synthase [Pelagibius litoralis]NIA72210.1 threonine synthase [Pelagibius litoralis]
MRYLSTRGKAPVLSFDEALLTGLARDGGLYLPESWPSFSPQEIRALAGKPYAEVAYAVIKPFVGDCIADADLRRILTETYGVFGHRAVAPLKQLDERTWLMELFHGPTLAFKDYALQLVGHLFDHVLRQRGERVTVIGATSGDTGSAAIEACRDRDQVDIFMLHPKGRTSEVQRRQMTTILSSNVHNIAVEGTFDDCQDQVKAMFNDIGFRDAMNLSAVNSINWARIMAQIVYYFVAAVALGAPDRAIAFAVPTGNFGNIYAAYAAGRMGLPVSQLIVGSNSNDILTRFFNSGTMEMAPVNPTISPSMDIQVSSNFERLLFDVLDRDGDKVSATLTGFRETGRFDVTAEQLQRLRRLFDCHRLSDEETMAEIAARLQTSGELLDPHSAIGTAAAAAALRDDVAVVVALACAHPAKFPDAVEKASGVRPQLPARLADLYEREERCTVLPNDLSALQGYISGNRPPADAPSSDTSASSVRGAA